VRFQEVDRPAVGRPGDRPVVRRQIRARLVASEIERAGLRNRDGRKATRGSHLDDRTLVLSVDLDTPHQDERRDVTAMTRARGRHAAVAVYMRAAESPPRVRCCFYVIWRGETAVRSAAHGNRRSLRRPLLRPVPCPQASAPAVGTTRPVCRVQTWPFRTRGDGHVVALIAWQKRTQFPLFRTFCRAARLPFARPDSVHIRR
jgi:hypothetical protein